ncbi:hypothetical protein [Micromonospora tarensis]|uniref:Uncharacterized protein n=1 Tax=Micromonospora tarensis TaxID=2806100 RepID=A0ABS1YD71_9ACTN|nr:hypothetical protein [Micromonospora tarensis]MBM0275362.1 hypothetical protein [Micromonospora tarensis]
MHPQSTEPQSPNPTPTPGPSYFKAVDDLQAAMGELISRCHDDPRGWIANAAAKSGALAAEQNKLAPTKPDVRQQLAAHLHRIADDIVSQQLPLYELLSARLSLGVLDSRADLQRWADYLGTEIAEDGGTDDNIPHIEHKTLFDDTEWGPWLSVQAQINPDADRTEAGA